ncbi:thioredoxin-related transmembrane protein 1-like [Sycon ciliatum]|uniref:thioredoxin-related transmembrane protein 1-like n=1 Tax=Sycon ciliatum TaxID=27933 RepID=UPI0031F6090F
MTWPELKDLFFFYTWQRTACSNCKCVIMARLAICWAGCLLLALLCTTGYCQAEVVEITDSNLQMLHEGEWMIKFHAPWCPACQQFAAPWISLARELKETHPHVRFANVDVTEQPILSGRFLIQHLPTLYHVKDNAFRKYDGKRSEEDIEVYIKDELWKNSEPLPWFTSPMGPSGMILGYAMVSGNHLQQYYNHLTEKQQIPPWLVIACGVMTVITSGVLLGLVLLFCINMFNSVVMPAPPVPVPQQATQPVGPDPTFGSTGENDEPDRKKGVKASPKPSPKPSPQPSAGVAKDSSLTTSPKQRKGKKLKASTD